MRKAYILGLLLGLMIAPDAYAGGPYGSLNVGNWSGGAFTDTKTGQFSNCIASAPYRSGILLLVMVSSNGTWSLGFRHQSWHLRLGEKFPLALTFDGKRPFHVSAKAIDEHIVFVPMPHDSRLIAQFKKSRVMSAFAAGSLYQFSLDLTSIILPSLANCVIQMNSKGVQAAGDFIIRNALTNNVAGTNGGGLSSSNIKPASPEYQAEAAALAYNFLMKVHLSNAHLVSHADTPVALATYGAAWKADNVSGFVRIIPTGPEMKGLDVAATIAGNDAKACKGKFVSGRTSELVDSEVVFRGFASCEDSEGSRTAQYFVVPRHKGGFVMFSVQSNAKTGEVSTLKEDDIADYRKAALVAVSQ